MMKLSTKIIITVAALMFSVVQSYASETCAADVNTCTPKQLCEASTSMMNNNKVWSVDPAYVEHVAMSKQLGINCGVVDVVAPTCETDAELCAVSALCEQATVASGSAKAWSEAAGKAGHVSLAKEYGLACDVLVVEAQASNVCTSKNLIQCSDKQICSDINAMAGTDYFNIYNAEAKKRGLTCGVSGTSTDIYADTFKSQSLLKRQQLQYALKKLGFYSSSIDGLWGSGTSSAIVEYAQANGVNSSNPSSVFSSILSKVDVPSSFEVAKPKVKVQESNAYGLVAIIPNPSVPASQAWAICDPQGDIAAGQAGAAYKAPSYGYSGSCNSYGGYSNCNATANSGGFWGGFAEGMAKNIISGKARKSALRSCLAQYGWRE